MFEAAYPPGQRGEVDPNYVLDKVGAFSRGLLSGTVDGLEKRSRSFDCQTIDARTFEYRINSFLRPSLADGV